MKIKAIFFDIDGTLLSYRTHQVLPGTKEALRQLRQKGILTFISSGRPKVLIPPMPVTFDGYITVNGGYCLAGDRVILRHPIDEADCRRWIEYVEERGMITMCFTAEQMYINRIDQKCLDLQRQLGFEMPPIMSLKELFDGHHPAEDREIYQFIAMQPADEDPKVLSMLSHCRMPRWHPDFTDIIPDGSSKAVGIELILNHYGFCSEEAMAFGDGANDIEMLEYVGIGVAMGNAADIVKQHADIVTDDAESEGILHALERTGVL